MSHCPIKNTHRSLLFERILFVSRFFPRICSAISSQKKRAISPMHGNIHTNIFIWGRNTSQRLEKPQPTERDGSDTDPDIGIHCHDIGRKSLHQDHSWGPRRSHIAVWAQANKTCWKKHFQKHIVRGTRYILYHSTGVSSRRQILGWHDPRRIKTTKTLQEVLKFSSEK